MKKSNYITKGWNIGNKEQIQLLMVMMMMMGGGGRDDVQNDQRNSKAFLGYRDRERKKRTS